MSENKIRKQRLESANQSLSYLTPLLAEDLKNKTIKILEDNKNLLAENEMLLDDLEHYKEQYSKCNSRRKHLEHENEQMKKANKMRKDIMSILNQRFKKDFTDIVMRYKEKHGL